MTTFTEELDDVFLHFAKRIESTPRGKTYSWSDEREALLNLVSERIIEREEWVDRALSSGARSKHTQTARNNLRREQRTRLYEGTKEKV